jgi:hypothetical protein
MKRQSKIVITVTSALLVALSLFVTHSLLVAQKQAQTNACAGNMRLLDSAKEQWALSTHSTNGPVSINGLLEYVPKSRMPMCPGGGSYTVGNVDVPPRCSIHGTVEDRHYPRWWE